MNEGALRRQLVLMLEELRGGRSYWLQSAVIALIAFAYWQLWQSNPFGWWSIDGYPTLVAGKLWLAGKGSSVYHPELWVRAAGNTDWRQALIDLQIIPATTSFVYHPFYLWVTAPLLGWMDYPTFAYALLALNAVAIGFLATELGLFAKAESQDLRYLLVLGVAFSFPALYAAFLGQNIIAAVLFVLVGNRWMASGQHARASLLLTLAVAMKVWLLPLVLLIGLLNRRVAFLRLLVLLVALLYVLPTLLDPLVMERYAEVAQRLSRITVFPYNNVSVRSFLTRLADVSWITESHIWRPRIVASEIHALERMVWSWCALVAAVVWWRYRPDRVRTFAAGCAFVLLLPGVCWTHYYLFALPPLALLAVDSSRWKAWIGGCGLLACVLPWHNLPAQPEKWPTPQAIAAAPDLTVALLALPNALIFMVGVLALASGKREGRSAIDSSRVALEHAGA